MPFESETTAGSSFQIVSAAMLKARAPHTVHALKTFNSGLDDERNDVVECIVRSDSRLFRYIGEDV